jgi:NitT/TauT family transport system substrate-binding protein
MNPNSPRGADPADSGLSRRSFVQFSAFTGLALAVAPALVACSDDASSASSGKVQLVHASKDTLILWAVTYFAEDEGYYRDAGLDVKRVLLAGGPPALAALLAGDGAGNLSAPGELLAAVGQGQDLQVLMAHTNTMPGTVVVSKQFAERAGVTGDSPLADRQQALAKVSTPRIGITGPGSITDAIGRLAVQQAGLDPATEAQLVPLGTASNSIAALQNDQIDGFFGFAPGAETAIDQLDAVPLLVNQSGEIRGGDRFQGMTLQARTKDVKANGSTYKALVEADVKALKAIVEDPDGAGKTLRAKRFKDVDEVIWDMMWQRIQASWGSPYVTEDSLSAWFEGGLVDGGKADGAGFPYSDVINMSFVDAAVDTLGWTQVKQ